MQRCRAIKGCSIIVKQKRPSANEKAEGIHIFQRELNPNLFRADLALRKQDYRLVRCTPTILVSYKNFHAFTSKTPLGVILICGITGSAIKDSVINGS